MKKNKVEDIWNKDELREILRKIKRENVKKKNEKKDDFKKTNMS